MTTHARISTVRACFRFYGTIHATLDTKEVEHIAKTNKT